MVSLSGGNAWDAKVMQMVEGFGKTYNNMVIHFNEFRHLE